MPAVQGHPVFNPMRPLIVALLCLTTLASTARAELPPSTVQVLTQLIAEVPAPAPQVGTGARALQLVPAGALTQGQEVYYTVRITNPNAVFAREVSVVQQIPANTHYVAGSASGPGARIDFSVDGGRTFAAPRQLRLEGEADKPAPPHSYTHIRWRLRNPLAPGAVALARFRAVFE